MRTWQATCNFGDTLDDDAIGIGIGIGIGIAIATV
jgi:hypothetical protein